MTAKDRILTVEGFRVYCVDTCVTFGTLNYEDYGIFPILVFIINRSTSTSNLVRRRILRYKPEVTLNPESQTASLGPSWIHCFYNKSLIKIKNDKC